MNDQENPITLYQTDDGLISLEVRLEAETVWLSQAQMTELFGRDQSVISRHIRNAFGDREVDKESNMQKLHIANSDRPVAFYDLDVIISVGYRIKSPQGVRFRRWATRVLRQHLLRGYTLNEARFVQNAAELEQTLSLIRKAARSPAVTPESSSGLVEIVSRYTQTFLWLQRYDEGMLTEPAGQHGGQLHSETEAMTALALLRQSLIDREETTHLFARPRGDGLSALLGNLDQSVFGEPAYPTIESKAAHLLYFMVKNHPFVDGNKRSGAFLFVDFLNRNGRLFNRRGEPVVNDNGLAALTLLVAESAPKQKETMIWLIMNILAPEHEEAHD